MFKYLFIRDYNLTLCVFRFGTDRDGRVNEADGGREVFLG
jgi:hypothetical protein